ncbi:MAG: hypothetical protein ACRBB0_27155 [Pelagimonas sp.]|uniref:hypothetical protein n=1 Tax=Pelagimonas sp. TaxID=2073170 RepID=UPI003D6A3447
MQTSRLTLDLLIALRKKHGDLNRAMVALYVDAFGVERETAMAQYLGVNRSVVRRSLQALSESDRRD